MESCPEGQRESFLIPASFQDVSGIPYFQPLRGWLISRGRFATKKRPRSGWFDWLDSFCGRLYVPRMSKAKKLLHTRYRVNDLERTVKFYTDVLGLKEVRRNKSPRGSELVFLKAPDSEEQIEITFFPGSGPVQVQPDLTHLAFEVDSLEEFGKHLAKLGLKFSDGPTKSSSGSTFAFIDAPEGYEIELIQPARAGAGY